MNTWMRLSVMTGLTWGLAFFMACGHPTVSPPDRTVKKEEPASGDAKAGKGEALPKPRSVDVSDFLKNGGFENPGTGFVADKWIWEAVFSAPRECYVLSDDAIEGKRSLLVSIKRDQFPGLYSKGTYAQLRQCFSFEKVRGASLGLKGYFKILSRGATKIQFCIRQNDVNGKGLKNALNGSYNVSNLEMGKWHEFGLHFNVDPGATNGDLLCGLHVDAKLLEGNTNCVVLFDGFRVEAAD